MTKEVRTQLNEYVFVVVKTDVQNHSHEGFVVYTAFIKAAKCKAYQTSGESNLPSKTQEAHLLACNCNYVLILSLDIVQKGVIVPFHPCWLIECSVLAMLCARLLWCTCTCTTSGSETILFVAPLTLSDHPLVSFVFHV